MRKAMKPFIALVLTVAMILGTGVTVFAGLPSPTPAPTPFGQNPPPPPGGNPFDFGAQRNPNQPVMLTVNHVIGLQTPPIAGPWVSGPPAGTMEAVEGAYWRMARVQAPAAFVPIVPTPNPAATPDPGNFQAGAGEASRLPTAVANSIVAGYLGAPVVGADGVTRRPVLASSGGANISIPATPGNWYVTSTGTTGNVAIPGNDGIPATRPTQPQQIHVNAVPGSHQMRTDTDGQAIFSETMLNEGGDAAGGDHGHGLWLVWEVEVCRYIAAADRGVTETHDIIQPFLVNLPTFLHGRQPDGTPNPTPPATPVPGQQGSWIYDVHVWPKQQGPPDTTKDLDNITALPNPNPATSRWEWFIHIGLPADFAELEQIPPADVPYIGTQPSGTFHLSVRDDLDYRIRLETITHFNLPANNPGGIAPTPAAGGANFHDTLVLSVWVTCQVNGAIRIPVTNAGNVNWVTAVHTIAGPPESQTFFVYLTTAGRNYVANILADPANAGIDTPRLTISFSTLATFVQEVDNLGSLTNNFVLRYGNRPEYDFGERNPGQRPGEEIHSLVIDKVNPSDVRLDGAVFFLFEYNQVTNGIRNTDAAPHRIAISGGVAGSTLDIAPADFVRAADYNLVTAVPARASSGQGQAVFMNLEPGIYYLYEAIAPHDPVTGSQYRRITGLRRVYINHANWNTCETDCTRAATPANGNICGHCGYTLAQHLDPAHAASCANFTCRCRFYITFLFTNTRDFQLPMTGGIGTVLFTTAGVSLMGIAGLFLFLARKKDKSKVVRTIQ